MKKSSVIKEQQSLQYEASCQYSKKEETLKVIGSV